MDDFRMLADAKIRLAQSILQIIEDFEKSVDRIIQSNLDAGTKQLSIQDQVEEVVRKLKNIPPSPPLSEIDQLRLDKQKCSTALADALKDAPQFATRTQLDQIKTTVQEVINTIQAEVSNALSSLTQHTASMDQSHAVLSAAEQQLHQVEVERERLRAELSNLRAQIETGKAEFQAALEKNDRQAEIVQGLTQQREALLSEQQVVIKAKEEEIRVLKDTAQRLEETIKNLSSASDMAKALGEEKIGMLGFVEQIQAQMKALEQEKTSFQEGLSKLKSELQTADVEKQDLIRQLDQLQAEKVKSDQEFYATKTVLEQKLKDAVSALDNKDVLNALESEKKSLGDLLTKANSEVKQLRELVAKERSEFAKDRKALEARVQSTVSGLERELVDLRNKVGKMADMEAMLDAKTKEVSEVKKEAESTKSAIVTLQKNFQGEIGECRKMVQQLQLSLSSCEEQRVLLKKQAQDYINNLEQQLSTVSKELEASKASPGIRIPYPFPQTPILSAALRNLAAVRSQLNPTQDSCIGDISNLVIPKPSSANPGKGQVDEHASISAIAFGTVDIPQKSLADLSIPIALKISLLTKPAGLLTVEISVYRQIINGAIFSGYTPHLVGFIYDTTCSEQTLSRGGPASSVNRQLSSILSSLKSKKQEYDRLRSQAGFRLFRYTAPEVIGLQVLGIEKVSGKTLYGTVTEMASLDGLEYMKRIKSLIFQVVWTLGVVDSLSSGALRHNDLHTTNVFVDKLSNSSPTTVVYFNYFFTPELYFRVPIFGATVVKLYDWDRAGTTNSAVQPYYPEDAREFCNSYGQCWTKNPYYDLFRFLQDVTRFGTQSLIVDGKPTTVQAHMLREMHRCCIDRAFWDKFTSPVRKSLAGILCTFSPSTPTSCKGEYPPDVISTLGLMKQPLGFLIGMFHDTYLHDLRETIPTLTSEAAWNNWFRFTFRFPDMDSKKKMFE